MDLGCILGQNLFEDHSWQAVPDLPRPLASLWSHPGQIGGEKPALVGNKFCAKYICQSDLSYINGNFTTVLTWMICNKLAPRGN